MIMLCNFGQTPLFSVLLLFVATSVSAAGQPNIVIIYTDDHAQHAVSAYGSKINSTPNIDAMARDGMKFTRSFVANSICGPCRATLLTGLHSHANGQTGNRAKFRDELPSFAKSLQASGLRHCNGWQMAYLDPAERFRLLGH